jgi:hypothetical protein
VLFGAQRRTAAKSTTFTSQHRRYHLRTEEESDSLEERSEALALVTAPRPPTVERPAAAPAPTKPSPISERWRPLRG